MNRLRFASMAALALLVVTVPLAFAQEIKDGSYVQSSDGKLWYVAEGVRLPVFITRATDEQIATIPIDDATKWQTVAHFQGGNDIHTPPFTVGKRWRVVYSATTVRQGPAEICLSVNGVDDIGDGPYFGCLDGAGVQYGYEPGTFYLTIDGPDPREGVWSVDVQELR
jgi:hypothetical protein